MVLPTFFQGLSAGLNVAAVTSMGGAPWAMLVTAKTKNRVGKSKSHEFIYMNLQGFICPGLASFTSRHASGPEEVCQSKA